MSINKNQSIGVSVIIIIIAVVAGFFVLKGAKKIAPANTNTDTQTQNAEGVVPADNTGAPTTTMEEGQTYTQADGLQITIIKAGNGQVAKSGDTVSVNYVGTFEDGTKFDASADHGGPADFPIGVGRVIKGWDEGVVGMKVGEKRKLYIPYQLAYGESGYPPAIPAKANLNFEVELVGIK